ncbi:MAG: hypothetical protein SFU27_13300 [Thermonemataceae bacterium]|nr:hypothetical protein [Thermonemataceae bacterium]
MPKFLLTLLFLPLGVFAQQKPSIKQDSIRWDRESKKITIPYKIANEGEFKYEYEIIPYISQDGGQNYKALEKVKGFYGKDILEGEKQIWWLYEEENPDFDGQNMKIKLKADYKPSVFNLMNEPAMRYSALVPGLGQTKVRFRKGWKYKWALTSVAVYGLIGGSIYMNSQAKQTHEDYLASKTRQDAQNLYDEAIRQQRIAYGLAILGAGIWATDIVLVGLKGRKNRIEKKRILKRNQEMKTDIGLGSTTTADFKQIPSLGLRLKF